VVAPWGPLTIQFISLEKDNVRIRSSEKILKFVGEEPTSVTPDEIEKLVASSSAIVALFKGLSDGCMIARLDFAIAAVRFPSAL
jgi:ferritin-like metal-binding protein YciE